MAKFCKKCGTPLDENGICPSCDAVAQFSENIVEQPTKEPIESPSEELLSNPVAEDIPLPLYETTASSSKSTPTKSLKKAKKETEDGKHPKQKKRKWLWRSLIAVGALLAVFGILFALAFFEIVEIPFLSDWIKRWKEGTPENYAAQMEDAFKNDDLAEISHLLFYTEEDEVLENLGLEPSDSAKEVITKDSIPGVILAHVDVQFLKIENSQMYYRITAPDMRRSLRDAPENGGSAELLAYIREYAKNADRETVEVAVDFYQREDGKIIADYQTEEFLNAIMGGFPEAYQELYEDYFEALISKGDAA